MADTSLKINKEITVLEIVYLNFCSNLQGTEYSINRNSNGSLKDTRTAFLWKIAFYAYEKTASEIGSELIRKEKECVLLNSRIKELENELEREKIKNLASEIMNVNKLEENKEML